MIDVFFTIIRIVICVFVCLVIVMCIRDRRRNRK